MAGNIRYSRSAIDDSIPTDQGYREQFPNLIDTIKASMQSSCTKSAFLKRLPIFKWLPDYRLSHLISDFIAGLTVGLTAIPQGIAYGVVAGLGPQYGLYAAFMGSFVYIIFGTCKDVTIGPTAIMALMVQKFVESSADFAILACFLAGCVITLLGLLHFGGFLVQFISVPVTNGFITAAAITIASGQINSLLGIPSKSNDFVSAWINVFTKIGETRFADLGLGVATLIFLLLSRKCTSLPEKWKTFGKYFSLSRNALAVIIGASIAYAFSVYGEYPFRLTGELHAGLPPFRLPPFSTVTKRGTELNAGQMIAELGSSIIAIPIVSILDTIAIARSFSKGKTVDATQEMIALGLCNIMESFFSSMPITGSFTRTAVNNASGVITPLGGLFTGTLVLLGLALLTEAFYFIPKTVLAAIIMVAMYYMIHFEKIIEIWNSKRRDIFPYTVTVLTCLFLGLEIGILIGISISIMFILYGSARPKILVEKQDYEGNVILLVKPSQNLAFSSAEYFKCKIMDKILEIDSRSVIVIIDGESIEEIDSTVALNLKMLCDELSLLKHHVIFWNWRKSTAGVFWRLSYNFANNLHSGADYSEIVKNLISKKNNDEVDDSESIPVEN